MADNETPQTPETPDAPESKGVKDLAEEVVAHSLNRILEQQNLPGVVGAPEGGCLSGVSIVITSAD
jgi:hypothetical protein